jgi:hypothetical protein
VCRQRRTAWCGASTAAGALYPEPGYRQRSALVIPDRTFLYKCPEPDYTVAAASLIAISTFGIHVSYAAMAGSIVFSYFSFSFNPRMVVADVKFLLQKHEKFDFTILAYTNHCRRGPNTRKFHRRWYRPI